MSVINEITAFSPKIKLEFKENIIEKLSRKQAEKGGERQFFNQYWQPFVWAAITGFIKNHRTPINGKSDNNTFSYTTLNNQAPDILKSLIIMAIGKFDLKNNIEEEIELLKEPSEIVNIIDEYANGGFEIISRKLEQDPDYFYEHNIFIEDLLDR